MKPEIRRYLSTTFERILLVLVGMLLVMLTLLVSSCKPSYYTPVINGERVKIERPRYMSEFEKIFVEHRIK